MDDLVKRLRGRAEEEHEMLNNIHEPLLEAADRIEVLEAALREITKTAPFGQPQEIARAALGEKKDGNQHD